MSLTPAQLTTLKAAILAETDPEFVGYRTNGQTGLMAEWLSRDSSPAVMVWRTDASTIDILDAIDSTKFTPSATITGTEVEPLLSRKRGWIDEVNIKQMVIQNMLAFRATINAAKPSVRASLRDAVIQLPTGALDGNGKPGLTSAGGVSGANVLAACVRVGNRLEVLLAAQSQASDTTGSTTARVMTFEGSISGDDIVRVLSS